MTIKLPICWEKTNVGKAISLKAKLDEKQTHYFLACHSPMQHILNVRAKQDRMITEEKLYQKIMGSGQRDVQAVIYGDPGTGKSHLIHWLKLRCDSDLDSEVLKDIIPVLIERRSGSLKDALEQMIEQLGEKFEKYLDPVRKAIEKISEATARQLLANQLSVELGPGWTDRGRDPLPRLLRELGQACKAKGFGGWLCRDDGVIDRTIKLLTEASDVHERESRPQFDESDFKIPATYRGSRENSLEVLELVDELDDYKPLREQTANFANQALRHAVVDMVGLSGANLRKIFDVIRKDLQADGKRLALFVEDVSAMAELDVEVVNATEPQDRQDLCPMTAVLGMTRTGFSHLRGNQKDRIEILACVDSDTTLRWSQDRIGLAEFTARYLNAARLTESEVQSIAKYRREGGADLHVSKCTSCPAIKECHARFGRVRINDVDVGLYPLTTNAPHRILDHFERDDANDIAPNQRNLLIRVLSPVLSDADSIRELRFPHDGSLSIRVTDPLYWTELLQNYCGGWNEEDRRRLLYLAELWIEDVDSATEAAKQLTPLLEPLGFPQFSKEAPPSEDTEPEKETTPKKRSKETERKQEDKTAERRVNQILQRLSVWKEDGELTGDREIRIAVANFLRRSVPWDSERHPPLSEWKRLISPGKEEYKFVRIEGQVAAPATAHFFLDFPRNEETRELLEALVRFEHLGKKSWDFVHGEHHKRVAERWLRAHSSSIINGAQPNLSTQAPILSAVQFLCLVAVVRRREKLPQSAPSLIDEVFADRWETTPVTLSKRWTDLVADMENRHQDVRKFLTSELAVVQGRTGGLNFIDPIPVIEAATSFYKDPSVYPVADEYFEKFWKTRYYDGLRGGLQPYADLAGALEDERVEVKALVELASQLLGNAGYETNDLKQAFVSFCQDLDQLVEVRKTTFHWRHDEFDERYKQGVFSENRQRWGFALDKAAKVASSTDLYDVLLFDPQHLKLALDALKVVSGYVTSLERELALQEEEVKKGGDPKELERALLDALGKVVELAAQEQEATSVTSH